MSQSRNQSPQVLLERLIDLLRNFDSELQGGELRRKVQALIPVREALSELGKSLIPTEIASSARQRILHYFLKYPFTIIPREELAVIAAIDQWARRVRELRVEYGWAIISGTTAKHMKQEGDFPLENTDVGKMRPDDYILLSNEQDRDAAYRWRIAKEIRNKQASVRDKILEYMRANVGQLVTGEELRYVAKDKTEWARRVRELRTENGWPIVTKNSGRPDLPIGTYILEQDRQSPEHDRHIPDPVRREVLRRDDYQCRHCDWTHALWNRSDPRHLELHHVESHESGGENTEANLITLCTVCHDVWHSKEQEWQDRFYDWLSQG
ncbi:MAG: HNH endonuclease [Anaerolineae bacterium]|nr:HNH endonuclease [Anaerolineae bacterium]